MVGVAGPADIQGATFGGAIDAPVSVLGRASRQVDKSPVVR